MFSSQSDPRNAPFQWRRGPPLPPASPRSKHWAANEATCDEVLRAHERAQVKLAAEQLQQHAADAKERSLTSSKTKGLTSRSVVDQFPPNNVSSCSSSPRTGTKASLSSHRHRGNRHHHHDRDTHQEEQTSSKEFLSRAGLPFIYPTDSFITSTLEDAKWFRLCETNRKLRADNNDIVVSKIPAPPTISPRVNAQLPPCRGAQQDSIR